MTVISKGTRGTVDGYRLVKWLGEGMSCNVYLAEQNGTNYAIKIYSTDSLGVQKVKDLIKTETTVQADVIRYHPNVVQVIGKSDASSLQTSEGKSITVAYIIMEFVDDGELMDLLMGQDGFTEEIARFFFKQMIKGIQHCHNQGMTHRDLKPENMLISDKTTLKICDFGFAKKSTGNDGDGLTSTYVGTSAYMDPEVFAGKRYDPIKADVWSLGIILFITIFGNFPIGEPDRKRDSFFGAICKGNWEQFWDAHEQQKESPVSAELKDLLSMMMQPNKNLRLTIADVVAHPWVGGYTASESEVQADIQQRLTVAKSASEEQEAQERYNADPHRDFKLSSVVYYHEIDKADIADKENAKILHIQDYDDTKHSYRHMKKAVLPPDQIFSQLKSLLNTQGVHDDDLKMGDDSWLLEINAKKFNEDESNNGDEEEKSEDSTPLKMNFPENCKMVVEVLKETRGESAGNTYLYAKKTYGSGRLFMQIWEQIKANTLLME